MTRWNLKLLFLFHIIAAMLVASLFWPVTHDIWRSIDIAFFKLINQTLDWGYGWQVFWALANHKMADWVEDLCILILFIIFVRQALPGMKVKRVYQLLFVVLYIAAIIYFVNGMLFREHISIRSPSPTLVVENSIRLSEKIDWLKIKDDSHKSFPGDHGTTALLFAASFTLLAGWRLGLIACIYAAFLCMPRLITGAHWLSDVLVGSGTIAIIFLSWAFCTPMFQNFVDRCDRFFKLLRRIYEKKSFRQTP